MAGDFHDREIFIIDPDLSFEKIGLLVLRNGVNDGAIRAVDPFRPNYFKGVVFRSDQVVWVLVAPYPLLFILHKPPEDMMEYESRALFGRACESICTWRGVFHDHNLFRDNFVFFILYLISTSFREPIQMNFLPMVANGHPRKKSGRTILLPGGRIKRYCKHLLADKRLARI